MTLIYELDLDNLKIYLLTKNDVSRSRLSKVKSTNRHAHRERETYIDRHSQTLPAAIRGGNKNQFLLIKQT